MRVGLQHSEVQVLPHNLSDLRILKEGDFPVIEVEALREVLIVGLLEPRDFPKQQHILLLVVALDKDIVADEAAR